MHLFVFRGIPIRLHWSFLGLGGMYVLMQAASGGVAAALNTLIGAVLLFGSVLLHELGHAMAGRRFGILTRDITLYPFGGIANMHVGGRSPMVELIVAIAGPAVNFVLAGLGMVLVTLGFEAAMFLVIINLAMGIFNLLPAYPMDGGRVLRAYWSITSGDPQLATAKALRVSRWFAWAFVILGFLYSPSLLLVGGFLLVIIRSEQMRHGLARPQVFATKPYA